MMGVMTALVAMSIDMMLPALPDIGADLAVATNNERQLIISYFLFGLGFGQLFFGPLSDSIGRKPTIYAGAILYVVGCLLSIFAPTFQWMLIGRVMQGFSIAGPRSVSTALIRDLFKGDMMARVMSFIQSVFILIPIIAPNLGQGILFVANWQWIFGVFILLAGSVVIWFGIRQPETLPRERRTPFTPRRLAGGFRTVLTNRVTLGYTIATGFVSGAFIGYLNSSQQIFQDTYGVGTLFTVYFGALAVASGIASLANARLVLQLGMRRLTNISARTLTLTSIFFLIPTILWQGVPPFAVMLIYLVIIFFCVGSLFGNLNSLAMEPMGRTAGTAAAVVGALATLMSAPLGTIVGQAFDGTVQPLVIGFAVFGTLMIMVMWWAERGRTPEDEVAAGA